MLHGERQALLGCRLRATGCIAPVASCHVLVLCPTLQLNFLLCFGFSVGVMSVCMQVCV